jgi:hypothetical protein
MLPPDYSALELHLIVLSVAAGGATAAIVALWAANASVHWFWRTLAVWGAAAAFIPIRAYEPALLFAVSGPLTIAGVHCVHWFAPLIRRPAGLPASEPPQRTWRFTLADLLLAMFVVGLSLAAALHLFNRLPKLHWSEMLLPAGVIAALTVLCYLVVHGPYRILVIVALAACTSASTWLLWPHVKWLYKWDGIGLSYYELVSTSELYYRGLATTFLALCEFAAVLIAVLVATWPMQTARPMYRVALRLTRTVVCGAVLAVALLYWNMLWLEPLPPGPRTAENHFPEILRIAERVQAINPSSLTVADLRAADPMTKAADELQVLYRELEPLLETPNAIPLGLKDCTNEYFSGPSMERIQRFRILGRALQAESKAAAADQNFRRAADFAQADLRLGITLCRGGLLVDLLVGHAILHSTAASTLASFRDRLDPETCQALIANLRRLESEFEPLDIIIERDVAFCQRALGWTNHLEQIIARLLHGPPRNWPNYQSYFAVQSRALAINRLLQVDFALRLYHAEHQRFPRSLSELVPTCLPALPLDPFTEHPLIYRPTNDGFVLYSVGHDRTDDGGHFINWTNHVTQDGYDLDLDTLTRQ